MHELKLEHTMLKHSTVRRLVHTLKGLRPVLATLVLASILTYAGGKQHAQCGVWRVTKVTLVTRGRVIHRKATYPQRGY